MAIDAVLLDIDGTLVDSNEFHVIAWHRDFQEANAYVPAALIHKQIGKGADMLIPALAPDLPAKVREEIAKRPSCKPLALGRHIGSECRLRGERLPA